MEYNHGSGYMGDFAVPGGPSRLKLNPIYKEAIIEFIYPKDIDINELLRVIDKCIKNYVKIKSKYGFKEPVYIKNDKYTEGE